MPYYDTLEEDLARAKEILAKGKPDIADHIMEFPVDVQPMIRERLEAFGTIYGADTFAAYKLLESFVVEIEQLQNADRVWAKALLVREQDIMTLCNIMGVEAEEELEDAVRELKARMDGLEK